jgi:esterase/lipase superfamily enzyme
MQRQIHHWYSPALDKPMEIAVYGHYGFALLMIPTAASGYLEYEQKGLMHAIAPFINAGKIKVFSINSINNESWLNAHMRPEDKATRHEQFNRYVFDEVVPFIKTHTSDQTPIIAAGASFGALHAVNLFFKRPDLFAGIVAMSGCYDLGAYTNGFFNETVYFNSPVHYLQNITDEGLLSQYRASGHIHLLTGQGSYEDPNASRELSAVLAQKQIPHELDVWGYDVPHDWPTWLKMLPYYLETRF